MPSMSHAQANIIHIKSVIVTVSIKWKKIKKANYRENNQDNCREHSESAKKTVKDNRCSKVGEIPHVAQNLQHVNNFFNEYLAIIKRSLQVLVYIFRTSFQPQR